MYIDSITIQEFRTFRKTSIDFVHPDASVLDGAEPPKVRNLNLVIGGNGSGKTTLLKGVALASLGPAVADSGLFPYHLVRRESGRPAEGGALIEARYTLNAQDRKGDVASSVSRIESRVRVERRGDLETPEMGTPGRKRMGPDLQQEIRRLLLRGIRCESPGREG